MWISPRLTRTLPASKLRSSISENDSRQAERFRLARQLGELSICVTHSGRGLSQDADRTKLRISLPGLNLDVSLHLDLIGDWIEVPASIMCSAWVGDIDGLMFGASGDRMRCNAARRSRSMSIPLAVIEGSRSRDCSFPDILCMSGMLPDAPLTGRAGSKTLGSDGSRPWGKTLA